MEVDPPGRWRALAVLGVAVLLAMTTWFSATAVVPQLRAEWGLGGTTAALLTVAVQLGFVAGALASAALGLADRVPPRLLLLLGAGGAAAANAGLLVAGGALVAVPLRALTGAALALVYPVALKAMATWFRRGRGTALGVLVGALTLGSAAPHLLNGLGGAGWRPVVVGTSALTLAGGALAAAAFREGPFPFPRTAFRVREARAAFADRGVRLATAGYFGHMWELYALWAWVAVFALDVSQRPRASALAAGAVVGVGALGCWAGGVLGDRWGRTRLTALAMALSGSSAVLAGVLAALPGTLGVEVPLALLLALGLFWGFWVVADSAQFSAMVTEVADQRYVGTALTLQLAAGFVLTGVTIVLVPLLRDAAGWGLAWLVLAPGPALGVVAVLRLQRSPQAALLAGGRG